MSSYSGKTVLVTGHTGFKGSWLIAWLRRLGARVVGVSLDPPTQPCHFEAACLCEGIVDLRIDIRDPGSLREAILSAQPDVVFHLAAQPLVRRAYADPLTTYQTNVMGTLHLLESLRQLANPCVAVIITSDKCYDNVEWVWGYRETDRLGGADPYSGSKGAAELVISSHVRSFFPAGGKVRIAIGRAGNVIGGGDWAEDRIVPDCVRAWSRGNIVELRNPLATRPWQHVLEPLGGYLVLADALGKRPELHGEAFNFGPPADQDHTVLDLVEEMRHSWEEVRWRDVSADKSGPSESGLLKLNCDKVFARLGWRAVLDFGETVRFTAEWYRAYYREPGTVGTLTSEQIGTYIDLAQARGAPLP